MQILKKLTNLTTSTISVLLVIAILVMINYISLRNFKRFDLTEDKQYSISEATEETLNSLNDLITVKVYFSEKLPANLLEVSQYVHDILDEYKAFANGNLNVVYLDPTDDDVVKNEALSLGIPELQMNVMEKDKFQIQNGFLGIGIFYEDKQEVLPVVQSIKNLEYDLTSTIKKVSLERVKVIGFLTGHGEHLTYTGTTENGDYILIRKELEKSYDVETVLIDTKIPIKGIDTLVVAGPKEIFSERDLFEIDQFIMQGGNAIFLVDGVTVGEGMQASVNETGINALLENYGIKLNYDLVMDESNENVSFTSGYMRFIVPYPFWPKLTKENFSEENMLLSKQDSLVLPWASSLELLKRENVQTEVLATTSKYGGTISTDFDLNPNQEFQPEGSREKIDMLALANGKFTSYFAGKEVPAAEQEATGTSTEINFEEEIDNSNRKIIELRETEGKILVLGDSDFLADGQVQNFSQNAVFFLNAIDYLTLDSNLISIRSRGLTERSLEEVSEHTKLIIKFIGIALIPILVGLFAIIKVFLRRRFKQMSVS